VDRKAVHHEMEQARLTFSDLVSKATPADMRRRSNGTRWTNRQLLFHMLFGYLLVHNLQALVAVLTRVARRSGRVIAGFA
jgi:hypothetical protein